MPFFTIIMPIYNSENSLEKAIESIIRQKFCDFELLVVDDHSNDGSLELCKLIAARDERIQILQTEKQSGAAAARNLALNNINGRYVTFVDSDDWIEPDIFSNIAEILMNNVDIDCLKYGCIEDYLTGSKICKSDDKLLTSKIKIQQEIVNLETKPLFGYLWNGYYRADIIKNYRLRLDNTRQVNEDFFFNIDYFQHVKCFCLIDCVGYHYVKHGNDSLSAQSKNYSYDINRQKIVALINLFDDEIPKESLEQIFWMYTRFCYLELINNKDINVIYNDELFQKLQHIKFHDSKLKRRIMVELLRNKSLLPILMLSVKFIKFIKQKFPMLFAKWKR